MELAAMNKAPAFLNPSDSQAVLQGCMGLYWEEGRSWNYVGEEDWGATSTGVLSSFTICGSQLGFAQDPYASDPLP
ncbi:hypothetical protein DIPPA_35319 [Diplonema papillatum]|nr:hypothetical protein DIPPA_35319 [Diplonema papillatum]